MRLSCLPLPRVYDTSNFAPLDSSALHVMCAPVQSSEKIDVPVSHLINTGTAWWVAEATRDLRELSYSSVISLILTLASSPPMPCT